MALNRLEADLSIISKLGTNPGIDNNLSEDQLKAKFDEAVNIIKRYLNDVVAVAIDAINSGAVVVGDKRPSVTPCLWFDTSNGCVLKYINTLGNEVTMHPETTLAEVIGFDSFKNKITAVQVTLKAANWSASAPYVQTVTVDGMSENWKAGAHTLVSSGNTESDKAAVKAEACLFYIDTGNGTMTFTCDENKPEVDFTIEIPGVIQVEVPSDADNS